MVEERAKKPNNGLTSFDLSNKKLTTLPPTITQLKWLRTLDLSENWLDSIPTEVFQLLNLTTLSLKGKKYFCFNLKLLFF